MVRKKKIKLIANLELWERRENETAKAFAAFVSYRDQSPHTRAVRIAAENTGGSKKQFEKWATRHDWIERAAAYDDFIDQFKRDKSLDVIGEMADRQAEAAMKLQNIAVESLDRIAREMEKNPEMRLKEGNIMHFLTQGATMERVARGEPSEISKDLTDKIVEIKWKGPPVESDDASDASGPVEGAPE